MQKIKKKNNSKLYKNALQTQADILIPVFLGWTVTRYSTIQDVIIGRLVQYVYDNPIRDKEAPILPDLLNAFDNIAVSKDEHQLELNNLKSKLEDFLETLTGQTFTSGEQYNISPVANAIDFSGLDGDLFKFFMTFTCIRLAGNAMANDMRCQIVLNEYKVLLEKAPDVIRLITVVIDRMGRKEFTGLTRISQGLGEILSVDKEALSSIDNMTLLARSDDHAEIGRLLKLSDYASGLWSRFKTPKQMQKLGYREAFSCEAGEWNRLHLIFPDLMLELMNTSGNEKGIREAAYAKYNDPYDRINEIKRLRKNKLDERDENENPKNVIKAKSHVDSSDNSNLAPML
jgi:hypothetical protein